jgi:hypothetical protein
LVSRPCETSSSFTVEESGSRVRWARDRRLPSRCHCRLTDTTRLLDSRRVCHAEAVPSQERAPCICAIRSARLATRMAAFQTCKEVCEGPLLCCQTGRNGSNCDCRPSNRLHSDSTVAERPGAAVRGTSGERTLDGTNRPAALIKRRLPILPGRIRTCTELTAGAS